MKIIKLKVRINDIGSRLDSFLTNKIPKFSRSFFQKLIKNNNVLVNKQESKPSYQIEKNNEIIVRLPSKKKEKLKPINKNIDIIYENKDILVVNKPAGMVVHPGNGHDNDTLVNALLKKINPDDKKINILRAGIVHRLDKDTSGILIIAKNEEAYNWLIDQFKKQKVLKKYIALVKGKVKPAKGVIEAPISRSPKDRQKMAIVLPGKGKEASTEYRVLKYINNFTLLEVIPKTGRTHQIRVHLFSIGYPIAGDKKYGGKSRTKIFSRQVLHAFYLKLMLPSGEIREFRAELPLDLKNVLKILET